MKKALYLVFPLLALSLAGCVKYNGQGKDGPTSGSGATTSGSATPVDPAIDVTYYLNLGPNGLLDGQPGTACGANLEYGVKIDGKSGDALPTRGKITSSQYNVEFKYWVLDGTQDIISTVPSENNCVFVAIFGPIDPKARTKNIPDSGFGIKFGDDTYYVGTEAGKERPDDPVDKGRDQLRITNAYFLKGETFTFVNFSDGSTWADEGSIDPYSLGGTDMHSTNWLNYFRVENEKYRVMKDFTTDDIYIKLRYNDNMIWFK